MILLLFAILEKGKNFLYAEIYFLLTNVISAVYMAKCGCLWTKKPTEKMPLNA
jgi:hypothetical protein